MAGLPDLWWQYATRLPSHSPPPATGTTGNLEAIFFLQPMGSSQESITGPGIGQRQPQGHEETKESGANVGGNSSDYIHQAVIGWGSPRAMESQGVRHCPILFFLCVYVCGGGSRNRFCQVIV